MTRKFSFQHAQLHVLNRRFRLDDKNQSTLQKLELGHKGEIDFDTSVQPFVESNQLIHLKDLIFEYDEGKKEIQIDNLIIAHDKCFIFEVKKFQFNVNIDNRGLFCNEHGKEMVAMTTQVERQKEEVRKLLHDVGYPMALYHYLVFINPDYTVYGLQKNHNVLLSSNLKKFFETHFRPNRQDYTYFEVAVNERKKTISKYAEFYEINLDLLAKGVFCEKCESRMRRASRRKYSCHICNTSISTLTAVQSLIQDIYYLNPKFKLNSQFLSNFSGKEISSSMIRRYRQMNKIHY